MYDPRVMPDRSRRAGAAMRWLVSMAVVIGAAAAERATAQTPRSQRVTPVVRVFEQCSPAVVNLSTTRVVTVRQPRGLDLLFEDIFDMPRPRQRQFKTHSVGSGFLIHEDGYLVTNAHVIEQAAEISVTLADGTELPAEEVARDRQNDLAILKVDAPQPLPHLKLGRSDDLMPGETVIAIGNPLGYQHTVTSGIVSALDRELRFSPDLAYSGLIQTDASINPGNSGGPLLNVHGELIGVNTAIRGDAQNIGFAIPVDELHELLPTMLDIERIRRVDFGIHFDGAGGSAAQAGVRVGRVDARSPAAGADIKEGDRVVSVNGVRTDDFIDAFGALNRARPGDTVSIEVVRDGARKTARVAFEALPAADAPVMLGRYFGLSAREFRRLELRRLGIERPVGLIIERVEPESEAARAGVSQGDIVTLFGGWPVTSMSSLGQLIEQVSSGDGIPFQLLREQAGHWTRFELVLRAQ
jgi:serine protease Do